MPGAARGRVAVALWSRAPDVAEAAVLEMLRSPVPEVQAAGFRAAGAIGLGDEQVVVARLSDPDPAIRIGAVLAVRDTVSEGPAR
jgi:hypothetical protein